MNEQQRAELERIRDVLYPATGLEDYDEEIIGRVLKDINALLAQDALHKMAEDSRTNGLRLDDWDKIGCVNHDCDKCKAVQEPVVQALSRDAVLANIAGWLRHLADDVTIPYFTNGAFKADCNEAADVLLATPPAPQPVPVKTYHDGKPWPVAPKPWVGLTTEEIYACDETSGLPQHEITNADLQAFAYAIEAKLKEKNHDH